MYVCLNINTPDMKKYLLFLLCIFFLKQLSAQTITSIVPNNGNAGQTLTVTITGNNTHFTSGSNTYVDFEFYQGSSALNFNASSWTSMTVNFTIPSVITSGYYDFYTYNPFDGFLFADKGFYVNGTPGQLTISPNAANPGQTLAINITGTGTNFTTMSSGSGTVWIDFTPGPGYIQANNFIVSNDFLMAANFTVPVSTPTAYYTLFVGDGAGHMAPNAFGVPANIGIGEVENIFQNISATPNPFTEQVTFSGKLPRSAEAKLEIFNIKGAKIFQKDFNKLPAGNFEYTLHSSDFNNTPGIYFASFKSGNKSFPVKLFFVR
jgi:hypothetical protein